MIRLLTPNGHRGSEFRGVGPLPRPRCRPTARLGDYSNSTHNCVIDAAPKLVRCALPASSEAPIGRR
jgi:hypothetical protein